MKSVTYDETKWKLVPIEPTAEMMSDYVGSEKMFNNSYGHIRAVIAAAPPYPDQSEQDLNMAWISVDDRLPEAKITVLVVTNFACIYTCRLPVIISKNSALDFEHGIRERFTHWMPLPLPPAPKGEK